MKLKIKTKDCKLTVKVKTSLSEKIDFMELDRFERLYLRGFLKPKVVKKNRIIYTGPVSISLYEYLSFPISKRDFLFILEQIVIAVQKLQINRMSVANLVMEIYKVYINRNTKEMQFLYIPEISGRMGSNIAEFIEAVIYSSKPDSEESRALISRFTYFFRNMSTIDTDEIEKFVAKEDKSVVTLLKKQNAGQSGFMTNKQKHYYEHYENEMQSFGDSPTELFDDATGLLEDLPTGILTSEDADATGLLEELPMGSSFPEDDDATGLLDGNADSSELYNNEHFSEKEENTHFPTLFRLVTQETIQVNKPVYRIGKEKSYVDYFVSNNTLISRSHADIITRSDGFYVKDLNSKNRTYINGCDIGVQSEVKINDGDRLILANEEFIFNV